jgi:hypothetical protein
VGVCTTFGLIASGGGVGLPFGNESSFGFSTIIRELIDFKVLGLDLSDNADFGRKNRRSSSSRMSRTHRRYFMQFFLFKLYGDCQV